MKPFIERKIKYLFAFIVLILILFAYPRPTVQASEASYAINSKSITFTFNMPYSGTYHYHKNGIMSSVYNIGQGLQNITVPTSDGDIVVMNFVDKYNNCYTSPAVVYTQESNVSSNPAPKVAVSVAVSGNGRAYANVGSSTVKGTIVTFSAIADLDNHLDGWYITDATHSNSFYTGEKTFTYEVNSDIAVSAVFSAGEVLDDKARYGWDYEYKYFRVVTNMGGGVRIKLIYLGERNKTIQAVRYITLNANDSLYFTETTVRSSKGVLYKLEKITMTPLPSSGYTFEKIYKVGYNEDEYETVFSPVENPTAEDYAMSYLFRSSGYWNKALFYASFLKVDRTIPTEYYKKYLYRNGQPVVETDLRTGEKSRVAECKRFTLYPLQRDIASYDYGSPGEEPNISMFMVTCANYFGYYPLTESSSAVITGDYDIKKEKWYTRTGFYNGAYESYYYLSPAPRARWYWDWQRNTLTYDTVRGYGANNGLLDTVCTNYIKTGDAYDYDVYIFCYDDEALGSYGMSLDNPTIYDDWEHINQGSYYYVYDERDVNVQIEGYTKKPETYGSRRSRSSNATIAVPYLPNHYTVRTVINGVQTGSINTYIREDYYSDQMTLSTGNGSIDAIYNRYVYIPFPTAPEGYRFKGWQISGSDTGHSGIEKETQFINLRKTSGTVTLTAVFEQIKTTADVTIIDRTDNGIELGRRVKTYDIGATANGSDVGRNPTANLYYYGYGYSSSTSAEAQDGAVVYRNFVRVFYNIRYDLNLGTGTSTTQTVYLKDTSNNNITAFTPHSAPTREGYTFKGWQILGGSTSRKNVLGTDPLTNGNTEYIVGTSGHISESGEVLLIAIWEHPQPAVSLSILNDSSPYVYSATGTTYVNSSQEPLFYTRATGTTYPWYKIQNVGAKGNIAYRANSNGNTVAVSGQNVCYSNYYKITANGNVSPTAETVDTWYDKYVTNNITIPYEPSQQRNFTLDTANPVLEGTNAEEVFNIVARDTQSGLKTVSMKLRNTENGTEQTIGGTMSSDGRTYTFNTVNATTLSGEHKLIITIVDNVGRQTYKEITLLSYEINMTISSLNYSPMNYISGSPAFKHYECMVLNITTKGGIDKVKITFPSSWNNVYVFRGNPNNFNSGNMVLSPNVFIQNLTAVNGKETSDNIYVIVPLNAVSCHFTVQGMKGNDLITIGSNPLTAEADIRITNESLTQDFKTLINNIKR